MLELHVIFNGEVQGVGFRRTTKQMADELQLTGFVRNLPNGTVELVAQGTKESLQKLLSALLKRFKVHELKEQYLKPTELFSEFLIK